MLSIAASPAASSAAQDSDETLLARYREGDEGAFAQLYQRHRAGLYRFLRGLCPSAAYTDEIFQDTWLSLIRSDAPLDGRARFKTWLFQIARHRLIDGWRKHKGDEMKSAAFNQANLLLGTPGEREAFASETPETLVLRAEALRHISEALQTLPLPQREVFLLRAHADMELSDIAALTETPLEAIKSRYRYALAKLRQRLLSQTTQPKPVEGEIKTLP
jgi:RNA polymerase sigma-70 factor (ECF subfamily)